MTISCPRCAAALPDPRSVTAPVAVCPGCGLTVATAQLAEAEALTTWRASADQRLAWLRQQMLAQTPPEPTPEAVPAAGRGPHEPGPAQDGAYPRGRVGAGGSLLLATGAFLLVAAGIAFLAFTWDLLGAFGQIAVLLALGSACLAATDRLAVRLHATAVSLGVVGVLLVVIAASGARLRGPDLVGATTSTLAAVTILAALCVVSRRMRPVTAAVGELAGIAGATLGLLLVATAPADDAIPLDEPWTWWFALTCLAGAIGVLVLADRMRLRSWPWVGAGFLVIGSVALGAWVADLVHRSDVVDVESLAFTSVVALSAVVVSQALRRLQHHQVAVLTAALTVWSLALVVSWTTALGPRGSRGWSALVLLGVGVVGLFPWLLGAKDGTKRQIVTLAGALAVGGSVGVAIPPYVYASVGLGPEAWVFQAWPAWRGLVAGLAFVIVLVVSAVVSAKASGRLGEPWVARVLPLATTAAALGSWLLTVQIDHNRVTVPPTPYYREVLPTPDAYYTQLAIALGVLAAGILVMALLRRLPAWSEWLVPVLGVPAVLLEMSTVSVDNRWAPEALGVTLAVPTVLASLAWWWLRRPEPTPTWQTVAPPFSLALLPSTLALLQDTGDRWWLDADPGRSYQVRTVGLLVVAVAAALVGGRQRWSGLFFPGLALTTVIVVIELVDLGRFLPQWISFGVAGIVLIAAGARWEWLRDEGRAGAAWVRTLR